MRIAVDHLRSTTHDVGPRHTIRGQRLAFGPELQVAAYLTGDRLLRDVIASGAPISLVPVVAIWLGDTEFPGYHTYLPGTLIDDVEEIA